MSDANNEVVLPSMGEGVNEATLVRWLKQVGDTIEEDEPLLEVSTDKVDTEVPAPSTGTLTKVLVKEGDVIAVNQVVAYISANGSVEDAIADTPTSQPSVSTQSAQVSASRSTVAPAAGNGSAATPSTYGGNIPADLKTNQRTSPLVRKIAVERAIDLSQVTGTGIGGRITRRDVEAYADVTSDAVRTQQPTESATRPSAPAPAPLQEDRLTTTMRDGQELLDGVPVRREPMSVMRSKIADHMVRSVRVSPHVTTMFEMDLHRVVKLREQKRAEFERRYGFKLTYTPIFIHATTQALMQHPIINCSVDGKDILFKDDINIGCAVAIEGGLIVPVIKQAQNLNLLGIAQKLNDLVIRARSKKLTPDDVQGGTFSITNPGMFGSIASNPIINQPQVAILGLGAIIKRPVVVDDMIAIRPMCNIGITFDHRVVDGEGGARFLATLKQILENYNPDLL